MNSKKLFAIIAILFLSGFILVTAVQTTVAQNPNLLTNPGFEEGHYSQDGLAEITVPNGWRMHWIDGVSFAGAWDNLPAYRPETVVWNSIGGVPVGEELLWRDGAYTLKIFKSWAPLYAALSQDVSGLEVGRRYQLAIPIYTDIYDWDGGKVSPSDPSHGQVRLGSSTVGASWRDENAINYSTWFATAFQQYSMYSYTFTATEPSMTIWVEMKGTYPHGNNGFFMDGLGMYATDEVDPNAGGGTGSTGNTAAAPSAPTGPTATPFPTPTPRADGAIIHTVNTGDSFWSIAIQYAPALGVSPEQALPLIQELNNNPAFLSVGQELTIKAPGETPVAEQPPAVVAEVPADAGNGGIEEVIVVEGESSAGGSTESDSAGGAPVAEIAELPAAICVSAFNDLNGDGVRDNSTEELQADAAITLFRAGQTVSTYISDGISEPYCFENLEEDVYQVQIFPPADFATTSANTWAVAVSNGVSIPVSFGTQPAAAVPALIQEDVNESASTTAASDETVATAAEMELAAETAAAEGGFFSNIGGIIVILALVLVVLAGIGVILLRRA